VAWTLKYSDTFTDTQYTALPTHNAAWAQDTANGTWRISTNGTSAGTSVSTTARAYLTGASVPSANQAAQFSMAGTSLQREQGLVLRFTEDATLSFWGGIGYVAYVELGDVLYVHRLDGGGSHTQIASAAYLPITGDVLRFEIIGTGLEVFINGVSLLTVTDATHASGTVGMWCGSSIDDSGNMSVDNFAAYEDAGGGSFIAARNRIIGQAVNRASTF
jgi:hypothetical protein